MCARLSSSSSSLLRNCSSLKWLPEGLPGCLKSLTVGSHSTENVGNLGNNVRSLISKESFSTPYALSFRSFVHSSGQKDNEAWRGFTNSKQFVKGIIEEDNRGMFGGFQRTRQNAEQDADFVHIKLLRNNTFVTVTDSKGNKKFGASSGCLSELKGGPKMSKYAAEATAEHVGRLARNLGLKSVVVRVKGFTYFKKKRQAILSFREGFSGSRTDENPIICIEDATRRPHNGCRLPKRRRI